MMRLKAITLTFSLAFSTICMVRAQMYDRINVYAVDEGRYSLGIGISCIDEIRANPDYVFVIRNVSLIREFFSYLNRKLSDTTVTYVEDLDVEYTTVVIDFIDRDKVELSFLIVYNHAICQIVAPKYKNKCLYIRSREESCELFKALPFMIIVDPISYWYYKCCN